MLLVCLWIGLTVGALLLAQDIDIAVLPGVRVPGPIQPEGELQKYTVDYTIGSKWQQAYATRCRTGGFRCSRFSKEAQWVAQRLQSW